MSSVVTCPQLNVSHGNLSMTSRNYLDPVHLDCYHGYRVIGNQSLTSLTSVCMDNGNWSVQQLDCQRKSRHNRCFFSVCNVESWRRRISVISNISHRVLLTENFQSIFVLALN